MEIINYTMSLQELMKSYDNNKRDREKVLATLRTDIDKCIELESINALKIQNHVTVMNI